MALIKDAALSAGPVSLGVLAATTIITCKQGMIGITTDGGTGDDVFDLAEGSSITISGGLTVSISKRNSYGTVLVHWMAA